MQARGADSWGRVGRGRRVLGWLLRPPRDVLHGCLGAVRGLVHGCLGPGVFGPALCSTQLLVSTPRHSCPLRVPPLLPPWAAPLPEKHLNFDNFPVNSRIKGFSDGPGCRKAFRWMAGAASVDVSLLSEELQKLQYPDRPFKRANHARWLGLIISRQSHGVSVAAESGANLVTFNLEEGGYWVGGGG